MNGYLNGAVGPQSLCDWTHINFLACESRANGISFSEILTLLLSLHSVSSTPDNSTGALCMASSLQDISQISICSRIPPGAVLHSGWEAGGRRR